MMTKTPIFTAIAPLVFGLTLSACKYEQTFTGTYTDANGAATSNVTLDAYSKNVRKYCINLNLAGPATLNTGISADEVIDEDAILEEKSFNTKDSDCNSDDHTYLVGKRTTKVTRETTDTDYRECGFGWCERIDFAHYDYIESLSLEVRDSATDVVKGKYDASGEKKSVTDYGKVVRRSGCNIYCGGPGRGGIIIGGGRGGFSIGLGMGGGWGRYGRYGCYRGFGPIW